MIPKWITLENTVMCVGYRKLLNSLLYSEYNIILDNYVSYICEFDYKIMQCILEVCKITKSY